MKRVRNVLVAYVFACWLASVGYFVWDSLDRQQRRAANAADKAELRQRIEALEARIKLLEPMDGG